MDIEQLREKYRAEGFAQGVLAERKETINSLARIAAATDIEAAVHSERAKLMSLQAKEAAATTVAEKVTQKQTEPQSLATADHSDRVWASFVASKHGMPGTPRYETVFAEEIARLTNPSEARA